MHVHYLKHSYGEHTDYRQIQIFPTSQEALAGQKQERFYPSHIRPDSILVASVGTHWRPGCWEKVVRMVQYTNEQGLCCWLEEIPDYCTDLPYASLGVMQDAACLSAVNRGFEWLLLVDNDILPEPDLIMKLMKWGMPVVVPLIRDEERNLVVSGPPYPPNTGLRTVRWAALNCILIWTKVLNCFPNCSPFLGAVSEPDFYNRLLHYGHKACQDTGVELKTATPPTYFGGKETMDELMEFWRQADVRRRAPSDRKPIDPNDTREAYLFWEHNLEHPEKMGLEKQQVVLEDTLKVELTPESKEEEPNVNSNT